jgi:flagellar basal-body rod protein FlgF
VDPAYFDLAAAAGYGEARMAILANNLANVNTPGYKADQVSFSEVLDQATGLPSITAGQYAEMSAGPLEQTAGRLDAAIQGDGFFVVDTPDGRRFTRDGGFQLSGDGTLVNSEGHPVLGSGGPIVVDTEAGPVTLDARGKIWVDGGEVDTLQIVRFPDGQPPAKVGGNLFDGTGDTPVEEPRLVQGAIERSNVSPVLEMSRMIEIARGYEAYQKLVQTLDSTAGQTNDVGTV